MTEGNRCWIASVFAANTDLQLGPHLAAALDTDFNQFADATLVDRHEWIDRENAARGVDTEETRRVIARNAKRRLRKIVGAEREEFGALRNFVGHQGGARQFDHRADLVV